MNSSPFSEWLVLPQHLDLEFPVAPCWHVRTEVNRLDLSRLFPSVWIIARIFALVVEFHIIGLIRGNA